jgi:acyl-coenzyme A synthetase/AMP-(fatty) acid ligase
MHQPLLYPGVTHSMIVPSMIGPILAATPGALAPAERMRLSVTGGALSQRQIELLRAHVTTNLYNGLGATETNTFGYTRIESPEDLRWHRIVPGRGVELVDEAGRPVPTGELGLVRVSTALAPDRYLYDEAATRAFFRDGHFYPGDLGMWRADGRLALHGRTTDVINVAGHKVAPAPFEERLRDALSVDGVCLFTLQSETGDEEIHVVLEARKEVPVDRLTEVLRKELRGFPRAEVRYLAALPRNAMGKVLRQEVKRLVLPASPPRPS